MIRENANSPKAIACLAMLTQLQNEFVNQLKLTTKSLNQELQFTAVEWLRDNGLHGGGLRYQVASAGLFNGASINVSQIHFQDQSKKAFISATALSSIIHPTHPLAPSIHIHISWTELRNGDGYWRIMADLNPALPDENTHALFVAQLKKSAGQYYQQATQLGNEYFYIPALNCHRGIQHFYLERFNPQEENAVNFAKNFGEGVISCYNKILLQILETCKKPTTEQMTSQLNYHTLYFYQVLTLDKGTTAGLLVHNQNDLGTLASLPSHINRDLLLSWLNKTAPPNDKLVERLLTVLPEEQKCFISNSVKTRIVQQIREHYQTCSQNSD